MNNADLIVATLRAAGITHGFGVPSGNVLPLMEAMRTGGIRTRSADASSRCGDCESDGPATSGEAASRSDWSNSDAHENAGLTVCFRRASRHSVCNDDDGEGIDR